MLRIIYTDVLGRAFLSLHCTNHGDVRGHVLYSSQVTTGLLSPAQQMRLMSRFLGRALRAWDEGEWEFTDEC
jgi:hypothetical protein